MMPSSSKSVALVIETNQGIGFEIARPSRGTRVTVLRALPNRAAGEGAATSGFGRPEIPQCRHQRSCFRALTLCACG